MQIIPVKALADNYIWLIEQAKKVVIVDPGEGQPVLDFLADHPDFKPVAILLTHKHSDHVDGVEMLKANYPGLVVYGPGETSHLNNHTLAEGDHFELADLDFQVYLTAGHTEGHISYLHGDHLFCGDALFLAGCGRVFTGDYQSAYEGIQKLKKLPDKVKVYAGHEYSLTNLKFAKDVEPDNMAVAGKRAELEQKLSQDKPSLPSTIGEEHAYNPFFHAGSVDAFKSLRDKRDQY
ncbi:hydroxyacylglutathione hydrolase [Aerococcus urinaehominis]|uniref:Hydroxyacylglutathione hydrolase n=1 Tax=Aerococcus urinaehominis TaxID=128944 RepID=A0A120IAU0_9LACT|nr:hydroxyacylglutathione hydrolase [Aerococcus urinaehominis]AMB99115.1 hydroxyacylglutathione hydrolase [Aerococcus urinaehominis]SDM04167.1 hydroxyacylglutathione hydrolase [Aerococcus urinaehominis]